MAELPKIYASFVEESVITPSTLVAYLPRSSPNSNVLELCSRIAEDERTVDVGDAKEPCENHDGAFNLRFAHGECDLDFEVAVEPAGDIDVDDDLPELTADEQSAVRESSWCISLTTHFRDDILAEFHHQLRLLGSLAPDALMVFDAASFRTHSGGWLREIAAARVPPPPDTLYTVHAVTDPGESTAWFHSHGLMRCGSIELEMLDVPAEATSEFGSLFNVVAALFIERGTPPPGEVFEVGHDLALYWRPWEDALVIWPRGRLGRGADRDDDHDQASGVLFRADPIPDDAEDYPNALEAGTAPRNVTECYDVLEDEPILYHTQMETRRMSLMAKERFPRFRAIQRRFAADEDWLFHVKLGYQIDDCPDDEDDNEHLWFDLHRIRGAELDATLLNEPYGIARMRAGDRACHAVDQLSDWTIDCPHGVFDATSIGRLEDLVRPA